MPNNINPDLLYLLPRESLLLFEDSRLQGLMKEVANYYLPRNDQVSWGYFLRLVAQELARLDYKYQYDIASRRPQYLTPPDARRTWAKPMQVGRNYPAPSQFDKGDFTGGPILPAPTNPVGYRDMLVDLLRAYREGSTPQSIVDIIYAYTGKTIVVEELYKLIGQGVYDQSDRNAIQVSVNVFGDNPLTEIQSMQQLQEIVQSLYGAIDLGKPAHVGLEFVTVFTEQEQISLTINDILRIIVPLVEASPLDPMLWIAPIVNLIHPKTTVAAYGRHMPISLSPSDWQALQSLPAAWDSTVSYTRGNLVSLSTVSPPVPSWLQYRAIKRNTNKPPASNPSFWKALLSPAAWQAYHFDPISGRYKIGIVDYTADTQYYTGQFVIDYNGNLQIAIVGGTSGDTVVFSKDKGTTTPDSGITWENLGLNYLTPSAKWIQVVDTTGNATGEVANWDVVHPFGLVAPRESLAWEIKSDSLNVLNYD